MNPVKRNNRNTNKSIIFNEQGLDINRVRITLPDVLSKGSAYKAGKVSYVLENGCEVPFKFIVKDLYSPFGAGDYNNDKKFNILFNISKSSPVLLKLEEFMNAVQTKIVETIVESPKVLKWWKINIRDKKGDLKDKDSLIDEIIAYKWNKVIKEKEKWDNQIKAKFIIRNNLIHTLYKEDQDRIELTEDNIKTVVKRQSWYNAELYMSEFYLLSGCGGIKLCVSKLAGTAEEEDNEEDAWDELERKPKGGKKQQTINKLLDSPKTQEYNYLDANIL